jgi:hypothetical protein
MEIEDSDHDIEAQVKAAEKEVLEARAAYVLKNSIVHQVLIADPILKAVHSGELANPAERCERNPSYTL